MFFQLLPDLAGIQAVGSIRDCGDPPSRRIVFAGVVHLTVSAVVLLFLSMRTIENGGFRVASRCHQASRAAT